MAGRDRDEKQKQREPERELSKHHVSDGLHLRVCAIIIPPLQILLDNSSRDGIFFLSSMLYLLLDVLFLYVPLINEEAKCLTLDKRVKIAALVFRSVGDSRYLIRIYVRIKDGWVKSPPLRKLLGLAVCVLPIPQVAILLILPNTRGSNSLKTLTVLNGLVASQYFPRAYPLYQMYKAINFVNVGNMRSMKRHSLSFVHIRAKWMLNIFGYLVASHIFGAFWYYFSIQKEIECWVYACKSENGCEFSTSCVQSTHRSITLLKNLCPTNPPDTQVFDFGIFHDALESGMQRSTNFSNKYLQCLSMAIRNLRFAHTYYTLW
ncbi:PREDICTED: cyclic nucleotide-gated ion channel 1-like [Fragaria vesca subsp. vesca]